MLLALTTKRVPTALSYGLPQVSQHRTGDNALYRFLLDIAQTVLLSIAPAVTVKTR
jgi:hypothetical protein